jgi:hypothetical protein
VSFAGVKEEMRVPLIRFGSDDRPVEPWEERLAPVVLPIVVPLLFATIMVMSAVGVCLLLGWAAISPLLPRSWRLDWDTAFDLDPSVDADCPACQARLSLGPVDKRGRMARTGDGRALELPAQTATCPQCRRAFRRLSLGKVWSSWDEQKNAEPDAVPGGPGD